MLVNDDDLHYHWDTLSMAIPFEPHIKAFTNQEILVLQLLTSRDVSAHVTSFRILDMNMLPLDSFKSGFATDCPCRVWCRGINTYFLYASQLWEI